MFICFIDESNTPPKPAKAKYAPYFVIAAVIINTAQWKAVAQEFEALNKKFGVHGEIKWRFFGPHNSSADNGLRNLSQDQRDLLRQGIFKIISLRKSIKVLYAVCRIDRAYEKQRINDQDDLYFQTYKPVSERFQYFLQDSSREIGATQNGIMVADHQGRKQDDTMRDKHQWMVGADDFFTSNFENYVETIFLTPSHHSVGIQLADMVAGAVSRKYNSGEDTFYRQFEGSLRASGGGKVDGFGRVKIPKDTWE